MKNDLIEQLGSSWEFFVRSSGCFDEEHSGFSPKQGMYTVVGHIAHVAHTVDWFFEGAFGSEGFDLDFEKQAAKDAACTSLTEARDWFDRSMQQALAVLESKSEDELLVPLPEGPVMGGAPRLVIVNAIVEHTAHHRGSLAVYARLLDLTPKMPYGDF
jgi:uncharacterized damage-inducible protein DinB